MCEALLGREIFQKQWLDLRQGNKVSYAPRSRWVGQTERSYEPF